MDTLVYYFSSTGNSLQISRDLVAELGDGRLQSIATVGPGPVRPDATHVGLVCPVFCWGVPRIVVEFVKRLEIRPGTYVFAVMTYGGTLGGAVRQLNSLMTARGMPLRAGWAVQMPNNYPPVGGAPSRKRQEKMFAKAASRVKQVAATVKVSGPGPIEAWPRLVCGPLYLAYRAAMAHFAQADQRFTVSAACTRCGICAKVCPVGNIELVDGRPTWKHNCEQCMGCLQWCPTEAINWTRISVGRKRYHHPKVKAHDMWEAPGR